MEVNVQERSNRSLRKWFPNLKCHVASCDLIWVSLRIFWNFATRSGNSFHILWGQSQIWPLLSIYSVTLHRPLTRKWRCYRLRLVPWGRCCNPLRIYIALLRDVFGERLIIGHRGQPILVPLIFNKEEQWKLECTKKIPTVSIFWKKLSWTPFPILNLCVSPERK